MTKSIMWWKQAKEAFEEELLERKSFNRTYASMGEYDFSKEFAAEYKPKLDFWRPYLYNAINVYLTQPYILIDYSTPELEKIASQLEQAIIQKELL